MAPGVQTQRKKDDDRSGFSPAKMLYSIFQAIHHLMLVKPADNDSDHPLFMNKVRFDLDLHFKAAGGHKDPIFMADVMLINRGWRKEHIKNLIRLYERTIGFEAGVLSGHKISKADMTKELNTVKRWAKKNYGKKFEESDFSQLEQIAYNLTKEAQSAYQANRGVRTKAKPVTSQEGTRPKDSISPSPAPLDLGNIMTRPQPTGDDSWVTPRNSKKRRPESSPESSPGDNRDRKLQKGDPSSPREKSPSPKASDSALDFGFGSRFRVLGEITDVVTPSSVKRKKGAIPSPTSPEATPKRGRQEQEKNNHGSPSLPPVRASAKGGDASRTPLSPKQNVCFEDSPKKIPFKTSAKVQSFNSLHKSVKGRRITDRWEIPKVTKSILALGSSNFRRIENVDRSDAQIVSYSGLKLDTLLKILKAFKYGKSCENPGQKPAHLIIMAGINDMRLCRSTNKQNICKIYQAAKDAFPDTKISFCQIPMSQSDKHFSDLERDIIDDLNREIAAFCENKHLNCIPKLNEEDFEVDPEDHIHWTPTCADKTIKHIFDHLN